MRLAITSFVVLSALTIAAASIAGHPEEAAEEGVEAVGSMPPVQAAPPADTPIASPTPPVLPVVFPVAEDRYPGVLDDELEPRDD